MSGPSPRTWPDPGHLDGPWDDPEPAAPRGDAPWSPERELPPSGPVPDLDALVRLAADHAPSIGAEGVDRVLGPWAIDAARAARREAVALAAFLVPEDADTSPVDRTLREATDRGLAAGLRAARWAPLAPWRVVRRSPGAAEVVPLLPMGTGAPAGPVVWRALPDPTGGDASDELVFARIARTPQGWAVVAGLACPPVDAERLASLAGRLPATRPPTTEGTLRAAGHRLLRTILEHHWASKTIRTPTP